MPFELVQETYLKEELESLKLKESRLVEIASIYEQIIDSLSEEEKDSKILNDANDSFVKTEVTKALKDIFADVESEEIEILKSYKTLLDNKAKKVEKEEYISEFPDFDWNKMTANKDGTYSKSAVNKFISELQSSFIFPEDSYESKIVYANTLLNEEKELKTQVKNEELELHLLTKDLIETLTDEQVILLLEKKWIKPVVSSLCRLPQVIIGELTTKIEALAEKYATTYAHVAEDINETESQLAKLIDELTGNEFDMKGLAEFKSFLKEEENE